MSKTESAKTLLRALTDVKDEYVAEASEAGAMMNAKKYSKTIRFRKAFGISVAAAACAAVLFVGIHVTDINNVINPGDNTIEQADSPIETVGNISEAEAITGFGMSYPSAEEPYDKETITVYDGNLIEVSFVTDADETGYYIRKAAASEMEDISGDYSEYKKTVMVQAGGHEATLKGDGNAWYVATWQSGGYAYAIGCQEHPMSEEELTGIIAQIE